MKKLLWWIVNTFGIKTKPPKPRTEPIDTPEDNPPPSVSYFTRNAPDQLEIIMREFIIPGLVNYRKTHGFYPPTEIRLLRNVFHRPGKMSDDAWNQILQKISEKIAKLEEGA